MSEEKITSVGIYPPIGIARIGNSKEYFLATEIPGQAEVPEGEYKDKKGRIKKEVARFRLYGFNAKGKPVKEITANDATIEWRAEVANVKGAWYQFQNALDLNKKYAIPTTHRNRTVVGGYREQLAIRPSIQTISGKNKNSKGNNHHFDDGKFFDLSVDLGHLQTDPEGRLLFFPGSGGAASYQDVPITTFANNDGWHDDTCDGVIRATVKMGGKTFEATPAMVAVTPPNFGQGLYGVVTMNDVVQNLFIEEMGYRNPSKDGVVFYRDIYPILERMTQTQWVNVGFNMLFGKNSPSDFTNPEVVQTLCSPDESTKHARNRVFEWFRDPESKEYTPAKVPPFYGDGFNDYQKISLDDLPITITQYQRLKLWMKGEFTTGKPLPKLDFNTLSLTEQLDALNQASLEDCLGGPFHPGIELTWVMRVKHMWDKPYRLKVLPEGEAINLNFGDVLTHEIAIAPNGPCGVNGPGSLTRWMGTPWQTDEASCLSGYNVSQYLPLPSFWAARVPNQILSEDGYQRMQAGNVNIGQRLKHLYYRQDWLRDIEADHLDRLQKMVDEWEHLGIVTKQVSPIPNNKAGLLPEVCWVEKGRHFDKEDKDVTLAQVLFAEGDKRCAVQEKIKLKATDIGLKTLVSTLKEADEKVSEIQKDLHRPGRKRRVLRRDER